MRLRVRLEERAAQLRGIATRLRADFGRVTLDPLAAWPDDRRRTAKIVIYLATLLEKGAPPSTPVSD